MKKSTSTSSNTKDYAARYGRNPERAAHRYEDANTEHANATGKKASKGTKAKKTILATEDYDGEYLNRRLHSGR